MSNRREPIGPWFADQDDGAGYRVVRRQDGKPILYVEETLRGDDKDAIAALAAAAPDLLSALTPLVLTAKHGDPKDWTNEEWKMWRAKVGPALAKALMLL